MENASKALIIAGAILLSILIISLGIMIFNQASGVVNNNAMTEVEVNSFNQKFEQYLGDKVRGANVNALIQAVNNNNMSNIDDTSKQIKIVNETGTDGMFKESSHTSGSSSYKTYLKNAKTGDTYTAKVTEDNTGYTKGGLISSITIK